MKKTLTRAIALDLVERIEALQRQIEAIYAEARTYDEEDGEDESCEETIREIVGFRGDRRHAEAMEELTLDGLDTGD